MKNEVASHEQVRCIRRASGREIFIPAHLAQKADYMNEHDLVLAEIKPLEGIEPLAPQAETAKTDVPPVAETPVKTKPGKPKK